jgi:hypothetical protein
MGLEQISEIISTAKMSMSAMKAVLDSGTEVDMAALRLSIAQSQTAQADLMDLVRELRDENRKLQERIERSEDVSGFVRFTPSYLYMEGAPADIHKGPFCLTCWSKDKRLHIITPNGNVGRLMYSCGVCSNAVEIVRDSDPLTLYPPRAPHGSVQARKTWNPLDS